MPHFLQTLLFLLLIAYLSLVGALYLFQRALLYHPSGTYSSPASHGLPAEVSEPTLITSDGIKLRSWYQPPATPSGKLAVIFHGNAGNIADRQALLHALSQEGLGFLIVAYRGYPGSEGSPGEEGLYTDARTAINWLLHEQRLDAHQLVLIGESLGSGVATQMATEYDAALTVLISPFTSIADVAREIYWYVPVDMLLKDRFDSLLKAQQVRTPILVIHGTLDQVVPIHLGKQLYQAVATQKHFIEYPDRSHNNLDMQQLAKAISGYFE